MRAALLPAAPAQPRRGRPRRAPGGPEPLTLGRIRGLVRLYQDRTDGSVEALVALLEQEGDSLPGLLGCDASDLPRPGEVGAAAAFVARFLAHDESRKASRAQGRLHEAEVHALRVAKESVRGPDGIELGGESLLELVAVGGFEVVGLRHDGEVHGFGRTLLASILTELRGVRIETLRFDHCECRLVVGYRTSKTRGFFRLVAERPDVRRLVVIVDLDTVQRPSTHSESTDSPPNTPLDLPVPPAFGAVLGEASP